MSKTESTFGLALLLLVIAFNLASIPIALHGIGGKKAQAQAGPEKSTVRLSDAVTAPKKNTTTPEKVALGKQLFFDPRLSGNNKISCASCHQPENAFSDGLAQAHLADGKTLKRNTPSLINVGFYSTYFWDGRAKSLEEQALIVIQSAEEMNQDLDELERELNAVPGYVKQFQDVFGSNVTRDVIAKALAAFQRTLISGPSPYDRYLEGDENALSDEAKQGMELFFGSAECARCHTGSLLTDEKFYRLRISDDKGRGLITGKKQDDCRFRTPSLRNVALTGPYMHDGSHESLYDVVTFYYRGVPNQGPMGSPLEIEALWGHSFSEIGLIVAFLESLAGEAPSITRPELP
jgi:cytochrome c peroxidase